MYLHVIFILLLFFFYSFYAKDEEKERTLESFQKMKGKELRKWLKLRNLECKGCTEKNDFVTLAYENRNVEIIPPKNDNENKDDKMDDIMATLREAGLGGNVFNAADLKGMNEDELENYFKSGSKPKSSRNEKRNKKVVKEEEEEEEEIEL